MVSPKLKLTNKQLKQFEGNGLLPMLFNLLEILNKFGFDGKKHTNNIKNNLKTGKGISIPISKTLVGDLHEGGFLQFLLPFLPYIIAGIGAAGAVTGGISAAVNAADNVKKNKEELAEQKRHNMVMEGSGIKKKAGSRR